MCCSPSSTPYSRSQILDCFQTNVVSPVSSGQTEIGASNAGRANHVGGRRAELPPPKPVPGPSSVVHTAPASGITASFLRSRPSFGRADRRASSSSSHKGRPMSVGPDMLASLKRFSIKDSSIQPRLDEETVPGPDGEVAVAPKAKTETSFPVLSSTSTFNPPHPTSAHSVPDGAIMHHQIPGVSPSPSLSSSVSATAAANGTNSGSQIPQQPPNSLPGLFGRVLGRNFDDDSDDDDIRIGEELVQQSALFERASAVLDSPARCGVFLNYLFTQNRDVSPALFYMVAQYFQYALRANKDLLKEQRRLSVEIFSTFLHEKSPLRVDVPTPVVLETQELIQSGAGNATFQSATEAALSMVQAQVSKLAQEIRHGMVTWKPPEPVNLLIRRSRDEELAVFELCMTPRFQALYQTACDGSTNVGTNGSSVSFTVGSTDGVGATGNMGDGPGTLPQDQTALALCLALATAYRYLSVASVTGQCASDSQETSSGGSGVGHSIRNSLFARSFENLTASALGSGTGIGSGTGSIGGGLSTAGSNLWTKMGYFGTKVKQKQHSGHLFGSRKVKHSLKNHNLHERAFERVTDCWACGRLLWGLAPQGLACNNCNLSVHTKCKSNIRETCTKEGRRSTMISQNGAPVVTPTIASTLTESTSPLANSAAVTRVQSTVVQPSSTEMVTQVSNAHSPLISSSAADSSTDSSLHHGSVQYPGGSSLLAESSPLPRVVDASQVEAERMRNRSVGDEFSGLDNNSRYVSRTKSRFESPDQVAENATPPSRSDSVASTSSVPPGYVSGLDRSGGDANTPGATSTASDLVPELVVNDWSDDPEMVAGESFEAAVELQRHFPAYQIPAKGQKSEDHIRMLCLLEFHQKTQYMVRYLKQYDYLLLRRWPTEHERLAQVLCLDQIPKLICLFRTLVKCIDLTRTPQGYSGMGEAVYAWLTDNGCANLKSWAQHCQTLSCSNMLDSVRVFVRDYVRRNPDILPLLQTRHNKFVLLDGLKQMRILYFNLPLIANNIVKDLEKTKSYKTEVKTWRQIHAKLASLPQTIDDVCMPLVKRINCGQLYTNLDKKDAIFRQNHSTIAPFQNLLLNFPRVLFHYWVVAHAEVTVDKLTVTSANKVNHDYIRERTEMLAILLHNALMFLVKDNERYILRAFKVTREHGSGGGGGANTLSGSSTGASPMGATPMSSGSSVGSGTASMLDSRPSIVTPGAPGTAGHTDRTSLNLSSSSFSGSAIPSPAQLIGGSLSAATGSAIYSSLFGGGGGGIGGAAVAVASSGATTPGLSGHGSSSSLGATQQSSGLVGAAASMAGTSLTEKSTGSGSLKLAPIFPLRDMFISCGEKYGRDHLLNIVSMDPTVLVRVLFPKEEQRQHWFNLLRENTVITSNRVASLQQQQQIQRTRMAAANRSGMTAGPGGPAGAMSSSAAVAKAVSSRGTTESSIAKPNIVSTRFGSRTTSPVTHPQSQEPNSDLYTSSASPQVGKYRDKQNASGVSQIAVRTGATTGSDATAPPLDTSDSTGSVEDLISPEDTVHLTINRINRLLEQIRPTLLELGPEQQTHSVGPTDLTQRAQSQIEADNLTEKLKVCSTRDLLMLLFDLTQEWLSYLPQTVVQAYSQQQQGSSFELGNNVPEPANQSVRLKKRGNSFNVKRLTSSSWTERSGSNSVNEKPGGMSSTPPACASSTSPDQDRPPKPDYGDFRTLTSSTPNLLHLDSSQLSITRFGGTMKVHDLRHSKRDRAIRSTSVPHTSATGESEQAFADRIEILACKLLHTVRQYKQMHSDTICQLTHAHGPSDRTDATASLTGLPLRNEAIQLECLSGEDRPDTDTVETDELDDKAQSLVDRVSPMGTDVVVTDEEDEFEGVENNDYDEHGTFLESDEVQEASVRDELSDKTDTLRPSMTTNTVMTTISHAESTSDTNLHSDGDDVAGGVSTRAESLLSADATETDDPASSALSVSPETVTELGTDTISATTLSSSGGIRDSGCMPSITDDEDDETLEDSLVTHRRSSTPFHETEAELTPTATAAMSDQLIASNLDGPHGSFDVQDLEVHLSEQSEPPTVGPAETLSVPEMIDGKTPVINNSTAATTTTCVGRTDSQKSTTSSGFAGSGED
ncbi:Protein kinase c eta type [Fasciola gigantica]|uniref:Protein kinase c eta type n=1 Tax=Fasciola gigantica TaxID=46835 RepID=A0A504YVI0_FASGI|nr:Protein kinase c eta type [Fasciola gigantica]